MAFATVTLCATAAGCGSSPDGNPAATATSTRAGAGPTSLTVDVSDGSNSRTFTVTCDPPGGTHPRPESACDYLDLARRWGHDPFAPPPSDQACAQVYGGPLTAHVTGTWLGKPVDSTFSGTDACQTARWDDAIALLVVQQGEVKASRGTGPSGRPQ